MVSNQATVHPGSHVHIPGASATTTVRPAVPPHGVASPAAGHPANPHPPGALARAWTLTLTDVEEAELEFVWKAYQELKALGHGELRISVDVDRQSGIPEIIYAGIHKQRALSDLRQAYRVRRQQAAQERSSP